MMEKNLLFSLVMPFINSNRRQNGGDECDYYVLGLSYDMGCQVLGGRDQMPDKAGAIPLVLNSSLLILCRRHCYHNLRCIG